MDKLNIGDKTAFIIERGKTPLEQSGVGYILGKFDSPTFSDKAYFTILYSEKDCLPKSSRQGFFRHNNISFSNGHYDLDLTSAVIDFNRRIGK
jgi:hypothetical protein